MEKYKPIIKQAQLQPMIIFRVSLLIFGKNKTIAPGIKSNENIRIAPNGVGNKEMSSIPFLVKNLPTGKIQIKLIAKNKAKRKFFKY